MPMAHYKTEQIYYTKNLTKKKKTTRVVIYIHLCIKTDKIIWILCMNSIEYTRIQRETDLSKSDLGFLFQFQYQFSIISNTISVFRVCSSRLRS